jgi:hypothetical protein
MDYSSVNSVKSSTRDKQHGQVKIAYKAIVSITKLKGTTSQFLCLLIAMTKI